MSVLEIIRRKEEELRLQRFESAYAVDEQGIILLDKIGEQYEVALTYSERERLLDAQGVIFTHNHPRGWDYATDDPRRAGNSFSPEDIELACEVEVVEMRVVTPRFRFSMKPPEQGWSLEYWNDTLAPVCQRLRRATEMELVRARLQGRLTKPEVEASLWHDVWTRVAAELELVYTRIEE